MRHAPTLIQQVGAFLVGGAVGAFLTEGSLNARIGAAAIAGAVAWGAALAIGSERIRERIPAPRTSRLRLLALRRDVATMYAEAKRLDKERAPYDRADLEDRVAKLDGRYRATMAAEAGHLWPRFERQEQHRIAYLVDRIPPYSDPKWIHECRALLNERLDRLDETLRDATIQ